MQPVCLQPVCKNISEGIAFCKQSKAEAEKLQELEIRFVVLQSYICVNISISTIKLFSSNISPTFKVSEQKAKCVDVNQVSKNIS